MFANNIEFKKNFVFEAMTGKVKFDDGDEHWRPIENFEASPMHGPQSGLRLALG